MDHICQTGEKTQFLPPEKHTPYPWHILARQSVQHRGPVPSQPFKYFHPAQTAQAAFAGACLPHGGWLHSKRHSQWRMAFERRPKCSPQLRYKDVCKRDMKALDVNIESWEDLATELMMWRSTLNQYLKTREENLMNAEVGKKGLRKGAQQLQQTRDYTQMRLLRQRMFLSHRSLQPQATLQQSNRQGNQDVLP